MKDIEHVTSGDDSESSAIEESIDGRSKQVTNEENNEVVRSNGISGIQEDAAEKQNVSETEMEKTDGSGLSVNNISGN